MTYQQHHVWFLIPSWGHTTSAHALINRMLQVNASLVVTLVQHNMIALKAEADLAQYPGGPWDRLHIVKVGDGEINLRQGPAAMGMAMQQYSAGWLSTLTDLSSGDSASWPRPTALVLDQFGANLTLPAAKSIVGSHCKTFMHWTPSAASLYGVLAPSKSGGFADYDEIVDRYYHDKTMRKGRERMEILEEVCKAKNGRDALDGTVVHVPGIKPMYDYEREASNGPTPPGLAAMLGEMVKLAKNTDGIIVPSSFCLEEAVLAACAQLAKIHAVGIQIAPRGWSTSTRVQEDTIRTFLDKHPPYSVLYISFGSMFFPTTAPSHILTLLSTLLSLPFPFVFSLGGTLATNAVPADTIERVNASGAGLVCNAWVDQQAVLQHPALGWFLSHGGWNSISESLAQGVPMIVWPLSQSDQAINAAMLATGERPVAFELMQIRQGSARRPAMRGGPPIVGDDASVEAELRDVFSKARGEEGVVLRRNAEALAVQLRDERDGRADAVVRQLALM
ncbi:hypothetical protein MMC11_001946 [Xylographa trunciseda]|nr:hypothetical protein [Xylographa trunciseda]